MGIRAITLLLAGSALWGSAPDDGAARDEARIDDTRHRGPGVLESEAGTARFARPLFAAFDVDAALERVRFVDRWYRAPGNDGFEASLDHVAAALREVGFGGDDERLELRFLETPLDHPAWTPRSARIALRGGAGEATVLHAFEGPEGVDRCVLPMNAPSCDVTGTVVLSLDELRPGQVLVTEAPLPAVLGRARAKGAAAVLSASLGSFNVDPDEGGERHLDAIQYRRLGAPVRLPCAQISPRSYARIVDACGRGEAEVEYRAEVELAERPLRTLVATVRGARRPGEAVAVASHVQEPGACDNATGVAGQAEALLAYVRAVRAGELDWPDRSLVCLWGDEFTQTRVWLEQADERCVAGISSDMTGQSRASTGAIALLERMPDPGAVRTLPPDEHSAWGAGEVDRDAIEPNGFAVVARCAMLDVARIDEQGWTTADHPWEGGSDHDVFHAFGVPAVLFWHFTDFAYHTSLDRMDKVDGHELRRTSVALLSAALAVADPAEGDAERYLASLAIEREVRLEAAREADDRDIASAWERWFDGADAWLRAECAGR